MNECSRCGVSGENARLYDAISDRGIVKLCNDCVSIEKFPIVKKPTEEQLNRVYKHVSVKDRLTNMNRNMAPVGREISLREIVDKNLKARNAHPDLIENWHWTIQRIKRARKFTREQFAKAIGESEATVRMVEQGVLPKDDYKIISKIESYLGVSLRKAGSSGFPNTNVQEMRRSIREMPKRFTPEETRNIRISDLKELKKKQEKQETLDWDEEWSQDDEQFLDEKEEINEED